MAKKLKFNTNGPSFGQRLLDEEMATFTSKTSNKGASLPLSYGLSEYATEDVKIPETKEKMPDQIQQEESEMTEDYSIGTQLWESTAKLGLEVGLTKKKDELLETEARWVPQIELAKQYLQLRQQIESFPTDSPLTQEQRDIVHLYTRLENEVKNNAKTNPYLQDIFYLTLNSISHVPTLKDLSIFGKTIANEVREQNIFDLNPKNNIKTLLSQSDSNGSGVASLTKEEEEYLWDTKQNELGWQKLLELLDGVSKKANEQYNDKTQSIINRENVLKKGNWFYDPSMLTKSFLNKVDTNILLWDKPKSWLYALPQVGSSFSEITAMSGQVLTSVAARTSAKVLAPEASAAIAIGEAAVNLFLAKYQRESETASEVFDNYTQKVLDQSNRNNINVVRVLEQWEPRLQSLGYDTLNMDDNEKLTTGMAQGLTTDQPVFENIRKDAFDGLQLVRTTNDALSYIDYFETLPVSYGGSMLWKEANKGLAKVRGLDKAVYTDKLMKGIEVKKDLLPRVVDKTLNRLSRITTKNDALAIKNKNLIKNVAKIGKVLGTNYFGEATEEGVQYLTGDKYQKGLYDYNKEMADSPMNAFFEMLDLGLEANLAYRGLSDDNYLNTDQLLKENMAVGGFISLVMPLSVYGSARLIKDATRNYKSDKIVSAMIAKNYANAELDQKAQTYYDALKKGKELSYITDYLEQVKENKLNGVTDDMIDNDIKLANKIYQFNHNSMINENLKMMGIKKGSDDHRNLVKSYAHIDERFNNANKDSERSKIEYDKLVDSQKSDEDDIYNQFIETLYQHDSEVKKLKNKLQQELKSKEIEQARLDLESLRNSYSSEESEIETAKQKISEKLVILDKAREDLQFLIDHANDEIDKTKFFNTVRSIQLLNSRAKVLNNLDKMLSKQHNKLSEVKDKLGLNVNTRNISNIRDIISDLRQTNEIDLKRLEEENGGKLPLLQDFSNQKEIDNAYASFVLNDAISNVLHNQRQAFITGKLSTNKYFNIKGITWNDLTEELKKNIIDDYTKFDVENGRPAPSLASIRTRYNNSQALKKQKMLDRADTEELQRELANEIMQENVSKLSKDEVTATEEKILEGTLLPDDKQSEEIDNENPSETAKTNTEKLATETEKPIEGENKPSVEATPQDKIEQSSEVTEDKVEKVYSNMDDFFKDVEKENEKQIIRNDLTEEEGKESAEEWEGISDDKEKDKIIAQNERVDDITKEEAKNNKAEFEDIDTKDESVSMPKGESTPDPVQIEEHINNDNSVETPIIGEKTEEELKELDAKDKKLVEVSDTTPSKPITIVDNTDPNQSVMEITDGGLIINNTFISDDTLIQIEDLSSNYEQTFGETGYYNVHPSKISENNDAIGNKRTLKVKHVSNTFFFQSNSTEPMNITVDGKKVVFRNDKGDELNVLPGKELSNRLIKKGWIDGVKSYYIVTNHVFGDPDRYAQAIHLVMEDKDGVFIASLRLPSYVDNEIRSNNYSKDELDELQKQKELLIALRKLITDAYLGNDSKVPLEIRKTVKPLNLRISNGQFNNQKELDDTPIRQNLSGVKDLGIPENDVIAIDAMIKNNDIEIGYGTGDIAEYVLQPNVIRKLGSDEELTDTQGKAKTGMLYLIPKPSLTPNGQVAPIQLNSLKFTDGFDSENVLSKDGSNKSLAELIYDLLTGDRIGYKGQLLDFLINHGGKTFVSKEVGEKYPFLELKMLYCGEVEGQGKRIMFVVRNSNGTQTRVAFDPSTATDRQKRVAIKAIADNFHWNTDKMSLLEELPPAIVEAARSYFKNYPNKKQFKMLGYDSLTFTREDVGLTGKPVVSQLAWMINTGKVQTDLGEHIYRDPFIYSDGVKTISLEEKQSIESQLKKAQETKAKEKKSRSKEEKPKQEEASVNKNEILSEDWTEDQIKDWMKLNAPRLKYTVGGWLIVKFSSDGRIKAVRNVPKDGATLASTNKGEGKLNIEESKKWLEETLGISANDVVVTDAVMRAANLPGDIYGALKVMMNRMNDSLEFKMFLSEEAGEGVQYHEGFHYVSRLLLSENTRRKLYQAYVKYNRNLKDASVREVEEAMAEDYRRYQLQKDKSPLLFNIKQIFKSIARAIGFMRDSRIVEQLYNKISKKEFAKHTPTEENMEQMRLELGNDLYYYIPGVTEEQIKNIPSITDANTFYKVVDALNSYVIGQFSLNSIDSLKDLATNIDDIFEMLSDEVEMGLHEDNELVIRDVIKNKDLFINQIDIYLSNFGITRTKVKNTLKSGEESVVVETKKLDAESKEETEMEAISTGDQADNTWDKESYTINKKENVALNAKLFFFSIPSMKRITQPDGTRVLVSERDEFLGIPKSVSFDIVWAKVLDHLWNINSYQDMLDKCLKFGKTDEFFLVVYDKLTSKENPIDEVTKTLIYNTVKSSKNSMITLDITKILDTIERINTNTIESDVQMSDRDIQRYNENKPKEPAKYNITVLESDFFSKISSLPKIWSTTFFLSDLVTSNDNGDRIIDRNKFSTLVWKNKLRIDQLLGKNIDNSNFQEVKEKFVNMCNNLGIQMDNQCLEYILYKYYGSISIDSMKKFWNWGRGGKSNAFTTILKNMYLASEKGWSGMKSKQSDKKARTFDRMFTSKNKNNQINIFAEAWGTLNPSPDVLTVTGADGNLVYVQSENNHMSDLLNWLKNDLHGKRDLIKRNAYSSNSMIIQQIEIDASAVKLNTYLNLKENISNTNRDFFGISSIEDYLSKMAFGFNDHIFSPTMSDKKTWHTISGMKMFKEIVWGNHIESVPDESGQMVDKLVPVGRRFSERLLNRFAMYLEDEYNAVVKYQASKLKVMNNDNLRVDNYFGSKKNHYADGNGGRFRYFNVIKLDGKILHLNEMLAKAEYDGNEQAYSDILNTVRNLFTDKKIDKNGNTTYGETVKRVVNGVLLAYCDKEISKAINLGVIDESLKSKILPDDFVKEFDKIAESASKTNNAVITEKDKIYSMIASTAINSAVSIIEIEKCFTGDPALYKWQKQFTVYKPNDDSFKETSAKNLDDFFKQENKKREKEGLEPLTNEEKLQYSGYFKIIGRDVDKTKRLSSVLSTGTNLRTEYGETRQEELNTDSSFKVLHLTDRMIGSTVYDKLYNMFRTSLIKEMYQKEYDVTDTQALKAVKDQHGVDSTYGRLSKEGKAFVDAQAKASAKPYSDGEINQADAAVYIRPEFYKRMMKNLGQWSDEIEEAYDIMERNDDWLSDPELYNKATKAVTLPLKMTYFGDHYDENLLMNVNTYNKMALFPLFRSFAKADNKALYDRMNKKGQEIDMAIFESAIKVGGRKKFDSYTEKGFNIEALNQDSDVNGSTGKGLAVYTLDLNLIRLQLNTEPHEHKNRAMGTLAAKIGLANIVDERLYGNNKGLSIKGSDIKKNIYDCIKKLSQIGKQEVYDEFFTDGKSDDKKIAKYILKQAKDSGMPLELLEGLKLKKGLITLPVEALSIRSWIQTKVSSLINKAIVDINTPGGSAIQMSSFGYEAVGREVSDDQSLIDAFNGGKKLKFLAEEGHMLVLLSSRFFEDVVPEEYLVDFQTMRRWLIDNGVIGSRVIDNERVDAKPYGIGYRIPTQGLSSMFAFHVADIMPKTIGDTIVVPEEFTAMTGSDFDVDKLYLATYAYKDGRREPSFVDSKEGYINKILDNYSLVLTDFTNIAETRASIDTLTSPLKKEILPLVLKANTEEALPMYELSPVFQVDRKNQYSSGKSGIAPFALNSTNHALTQSVHLSIKYGNKNRYGLLPLDSITGEDYQRIMDWLSAMINAHVDVAKDPYIMTLNVNKVTYNMVSLLLRGGKGQNAFYFLAQPILKYYTKQVLENQGVIGSKDVSKDELLNDSIKQQGKYLKSRIESLVTTTEEESNLKNRMILKFNSICDKFSTSKILTDLEDIDVEYDIVFDKEYSKLGLANDDSLECIYQNLMSAIAFRELLGDTERLSKLVQLSKVDTKKYGNTLSTLLDYQRRLHRFIDQNADYFYNTSTKKLENALSSYFSQTFLGYKLSDAMFMSRNMLHKQVIEATKPYKKIFNAAMDFFVGEYTDNDTLNDISNSIVTSLRSKAITTFAVNMLMTDDEFKRMIYGRNSIAKRLFRLKNYLRNTNEYPELAKDGIIYNELLNYLQEYPGDGETLITDLIKTVTNAMSATSTYKSKLVSAFSDLLNSENQNIKNFANDLVKYAFYTSFDNNSPNGFFDLVPISWKIWNNYVGAITKLLFGLNSNNFGILLELGFDSEKLDSGNYTEILTDIVRNMYMNDKIASPYTFSDSDNKYNMYAMSGIKRLSMPYYFTSTKTRGKDYIKILKSLLNPNEFLVYQKIAESFRVDKEGAVIKNSTRFIYKVIPVYGMKDDKINYKEFNKLPSEKSAFRLNAFPENLIVENDEIFKNLKDRFLGLAEKEGSEVVFKLTDAIKIQTQGLSLEHIQDTSELGTQTINDVNLSESNTKIIGDDSNNTLSVSEEITDDTVTVVDASTLDIANQNLVDNTESNTISIEEPIIDITNADIISEVNDIRTETIAEDNVLSDEYSDDAMINCRS